VTDNGEEIIVYGDYFSQGCHPRVEGDVVVESVLTNLEEHLNRLSLGSPVLHSMSVATILEMIMKHPGRLVEGAKSDAFDAVVFDLRRTILPIAGSSQLRFNFGSKASNTPVGAMLDCL
jgi:hypothetical protein